MSDNSAYDNPYTRLIGSAFARAIPLNCQFEVTYRCNHECTFCYNAPTGEPEMTTEQVFEALRKISDFGLLYVTLTGGEPLCRKDFFEIAAEVRRLGMALRLYTNGYLLANERTVEKLAAVTPLEVEISVHGARPESHDAMTRIPGSFAKMVCAVENLVGAGIKVNLKSPITKFNQNELFDIRDLGERLGCRVTYDPVITPRDDGSTDPLALRADEEFLLKYWGEWYRELHRGQPPSIPEGCAAEGYVSCGTGRAGFTVDPYGNILPCVALRRKVANILEIDSIADIWNSSPVLQEVRDLTRRARINVDKHENAKYFTFCLGVADTQTGDPLAIYPQAELNARAIRRCYEQSLAEEAEKGSNSA
jgi:MoaA/NifB/PqqE/SkfB family radical SAM enzyme